MDKIEQFVNSLKYIKKEIDDEWEFCPELYRKIILCDLKDLEYNNKGFDIDIKLKNNNGTSSIITISENILNLSYNELYTNILCSILDSITDIKKKKLKEIENLEMRSKYIINQLNYI